VKNVRKYIKVDSLLKNMYSHVNYDIIFYVKQMQSRKITIQKSDNPKHKY